MAITARFLRSFVPALVCAGLALAACSSDSDTPSNDPPSEGGSDSDGGGKGGKGGTTAEEGGEAGAAPATGGTASNGGTAGTGGNAGEPDPGTGGTPTEPNPGGAGAGGTEDPGTSEPTPEFLHGKEIYTERCALCHQKDLGGTGFYPNVSADMVNGIGSWTDEQIADAITKGADPEGGMLCSFMVPVTDLSEADVADLVEYLRDETPSSRKITSMCPL